MYEKHELSKEEIQKRGEELGLQSNGDNVFRLSVENKAEDDIQLQVVELERRGFKKIEEDSTAEENPKEILFSYDASLAMPRE